MKERRIRPPRTTKADCREESRFSHARPGAKALRKMKGNEMYNHSIAKHSLEFLVPEWRTVLPCDCMDVVPHCHIIITISHAEVLCDEGQIEQAE